MNPEQLTALFAEPAEAAALAAQTRARGRGDTIDIRGESPCVRVAEAGQWPTADDIKSGEHWVLKTQPDERGREAFARWLTDVGPHLPSDVSIAPTSDDAAGLHRLWCFAVSRIALPASVRVEARHDLIGIRLAQLALGFGADTLSGPMQSDRRLPVAGVTRPNENTPAGLATLVRQAGLTPQDLTR